MADRRDKGAPSGLQAPSLVVLAADAIKKKILAGDYGPGERLIEERLTDELAISRPPLREALRLLENEGLIRSLPRRGTFVTTLTDTDVQEILTLRAVLERAAFELGIPVRRPELLAPARSSLADMITCAKAGDRGALVQAGYQFHANLVLIADNGRISDMYGSLHQQLLLCMSRNLVARDAYEDLDQHIARHQRLLDVVAAGDSAAALAELAVHGAGTFSRQAVATTPSAMADDR